MKGKTKHLVQAAVIAAVYAALTIVLAPISYGPLQLRVAEALTVLPCLTPAAVPGLFAGCLMANLISPYGLPDILCGSGATLLAALGTRALRGRPWLAPLPPVAANGLIVGAMLYYVYGLPMPLWSCMAWVALGELLVCYGLGLPLLLQLKKRQSIPW
ncbi:MAG: QueT transporter family protein [Bacillota bacterium]|nr:QueT transporter family protein [Bacillota bacterium]